MVESYFSVRLFASSIFWTVIGFKVAMPIGRDNKGVIWAAVGEPLIVSIMPKLKLNDERNAAVMKSRQAGATAAEIGRQHGLSPKMVRLIIARKNRDKEYLRDSPFKSLGLSNRLLNALVNSEFETIEQVANVSTRKY